MTIFSKQVKRGFEKYVSIRMLEALSLPVPFIKQVRTK
jgi:hypothetical protein